MFEQWRSHFFCLSPELYPFILCETLLALKQFLQVSEQLFEHLFILVIWLICFQMDFQISIRILANSVNQSLILFWDSKSNFYQQLSVWFQELSILTSFSLSAILPSFLSKFMQIVLCLLLLHLIGSLVQKIDF